MVLKGPLIHHLEVSKQGFVLADLPFKTICGINTVQWFQMVHQLKKVPKVGGLMDHNLTTLQDIELTLTPLAFSFEALSNDTKFVIIGQENTKSVNLLN